MNSAQETRQLLAALGALRPTAQPVAALATLTRTYGSTFRRAGTRMLVHADGRVVCELSGGCPQRDIVLRAQLVIETGSTQIVRYNAESGLDVMMEMGCGGELEVLLEPLHHHEATALAGALADCLDGRRAARMATVFAMGGLPVTPQRLVWIDERITFDSIDDAALTSAICAAAVVNPHAVATMQIDTYRGVADVLIEPIAPPHALIVVGTSAVAQALLPVAVALGWETTLVDNDAQRLAAVSQHPALRCVLAEPGQIGELVTLDGHTSVVVITHNLERDLAYLAQLRAAPLAYLGALGSHERAQRMRDDPQLAGSRLRAPAGLDIGSETPAEIALAVAAEIMATLNGRRGGPLRDSPRESIHG